MLSFFFNNSWAYYAFYIITIIWILEFIIFPNKHKKANYEERRSFFKILALVLVTIVLNFLFGYFNLLLVPNHVLKYIAITLYSLGLLLRLTSIVYLGRSFTRHVQVDQKHYLVSKGPYRYLRHPLYLGLFLLTVSVPLFFGNLLIFSLSVLYMFYILNQRMILEEAALEMTIGAYYTDWKELRYRFIPYIF